MTPAQRQQLASLLPINDVNNFITIADLLNIPTLNANLEKIRTWLNTINTELLSTTSLPALVLRVEESTHSLLSWANDPLLFNLPHHTDSHVKNNCKKFFAELMKNFSSFYISWLTSLENDSPSLKERINHIRLLILILLTHDTILDCRTNFTNLAAKLLAQLRPIKSVHGLRSIIIAYTQQPFARAYAFGPIVMEHQEPITRPVNLIVDEAITDLNNCLGTEQFTILLYQEKLKNLFFRTEKEEIYVMEQNYSKDDIASLIYPHTSFLGYLYSKTLRELQSGTQDFYFNQRIIPISYKDIIQNYFQNNRLDRAVAIFNYFLQEAGLNNFILINFITEQFHQGGLLGMSQKIRDNILEVKDLLFIEADKIVHVDSLESNSIWITIVSYLLLSDPIKPLPNINRQNRDQCCTKLTVRYQLTVNTENQVICQNISYTINGSINSTDAETLRQSLLNILEIHLSPPRSRSDSGSSFHTPMSPSRTTSAPGTPGRAGSQSSLLSWFLPPSPLASPSKPARSSPAHD